MWTKIVNKIISVLFWKHLEPYKSFSIHRFIQNIQKDTKTSNFTQNDRRKKTKEILHEKFIIFLLKGNIRYEQEVSKGLLVMIMDDGIWGKD